MNTHSPKFIHQLLLLHRAIRSPQPDIFIILLQPVSLHQGIDGLWPTSGPWLLVQPKGISWSSCHPNPVQKGWIRRGVTAAGVWWTCSSVPGLVWQAVWLLWFLAATYLLLFHATCCAWLELLCWVDTWLLMIHATTFTYHNSLGTLTLPSPPEVQGWLHDPSDRTWAGGRQFCYYVFLGCNLTSFGSFTWLCLGSAIVLGWHLTSSDSCHYLCISQQPGCSNSPMSSWSAVVASLFIWLCLGWGRRFCCYGFWLFVGLFWFMHISYIKPRYSESVSDFSPSCLAPYISIWANMAMDFLWHLPGFVEVVLEVWWGLW